jgi:hypothetical protein
VLIESHFGDDGHTAIQANYLIYLVSPLGLEPRTT